MLHHNHLKPYLSDEIPDWVRTLQRRCRDEMGNGDPIIAMQKNKESATRTATGKPPYLFHHKKDTDDARVSLKTQTTVITEESKREIENVKYM